MFSSSSYPYNAADIYPTTYGELNQPHYGQVIYRKADSDPEPLEPEQKIAFRRAALLAGTPPYQEMQQLQVPPEFQVKEEKQLALPAPVVGAAAPVLPTWLSDYISWAMPTPSERQQAAFPAMRQRTARLDREAKLTAERRAERIEEERAQRAYARMWQDEKEQEAERHRAANRQIAERRRRAEQERLRERMQFRQARLARLEEEKERRRARGAAAPAWAGGAADLAAIYGDPAEAVRQGIELPQPERKQLAADIERAAEAKGGIEAVKWEDIPEEDWPEVKPVAEGKQAEAAALERVPSYDFGEFWAQEQPAPEEAPQNPGWLPGGAPTQLKPDEQLEWEAEAANLMGATAYQRELRAELARRRGGAATRALSMAEAGERAAFTEAGRIDMEHKAEERQQHEKKEKEKKEKEREASVVIVEPRAEAKRRPFTQAERIQMGLEPAPEQPAREHSAGSEIERLRQQLEAAEAAFGSVESAEPASAPATALSPAAAPPTSPASFTVIGSESESKALAERLAAEQETAESIGLAAARTPAEQAAALERQLSPLSPAAEEVAEEFKTPPSSPVLSPRRAPSGPPTPRLPTAALAAGTVLPGEQPRQPLLFKAEELAQIRERGAVLLERERKEREAAEQKQREQQQAARRERIAAEAEARELAAATEAQSSIASAQAEYKARQQAAAALAAAGAEGGEEKKAQPDWMQLIQPSKFIPVPAKKKPAVIAAAEIKAQGWPVGGPQHVGELQVKALRDIKGEDKNKRIEALARYHNLIRADQSMTGEAGLTPIGVGTVKERLRTAIGYQSYYLTPEEQEVLVYENTPLSKCPSVNRQLEPMEREELGYAPEPYLYKESTFHAMTTSASRAPYTIDQSTVQREGNEYADDFSARRVSRAYRINQSDVKFLSGRYTLD